MNATPTPPTITPTRPRVRYVVTLDAGLGANPELRLKAALKRLWRDHGLRCVNVEAVETEAATCRGGT